VQLVILAAGHGRRFGGLKQLARVGPGGEAIMDFTARAAQSCGYTGIVLVVREDIRGDIADHVRQHWPSDLPVEYVCQQGRPGTAQAVFVAEPVIDGPFGVANADDLYGRDALGHLIAHFGSAAGDPRPAVVRDRHLNVTYRLANTIFSEETVKRGICEIADDGRLAGIVEHLVRREADAFRANPLAAPEETATEIAPATPVSMNLWGFHHRMLGHLRTALENQPATSERELLLPGVVGDLVASGQDEVQAIETAARCVGVTHREDLQTVREEIARELDSQEALIAVKP
jgi:hypothetical protein